MAKENITTEILINASAKTVWDILMDFKHYPDWNPFVSRIEGKAKKGEQLKITAGGMNFKPLVQESIENQHFRWLGSFGVKGIFDGEHAFSIHNHEDGTVLFTHTEAFSGILVGLFTKKLFRNTRIGFVQMNEALKKRAEQHQ